MSSRATTLFSISVGTFSGVIALEKALVPHIPVWGSILIVLASLLLLVVLALGASTLFSDVAFDLGEDPTDLSRALVMEPAKVRAELITDYTFMIDQNSRAQEARGSAFRLVSYLLWIVAMILLTIQ